MLPAGVMLKLWVVLAASVVLAVMVKEFAARDCSWVGVHYKVLPEMEALAGPAARVKLTVPPEGSLAASW